MDNHIKRHVEELYATGKTTFRDVDGDEDHDYADDHTSTLEDLVSAWALVNTGVLISMLHGECKFSIEVLIHMYIKSEIKQLCIDYYGDE